MTPSGEQLRRKLFLRYAQNLHIHVPELRDQFRCPICVMPFTDASVANATLEVNIGHAYPEALGGRRTVLECVSCNSRLNLAGDCELVRTSKLWECYHNASADAFPARAELPSGRVNLTLSKAGISAHFAKSAPEPFAEFVRAVKDQIPVSLFVRGCDLGRINLAILHAAHLLLFREFGYGYLTTPLGEAVRIVVNRGEPLDAAPFKTLQIFHGIEPDMLLRIYACRYSDGSQFLGVLFPQLDRTAQGQMLALPSPMDANFRDYNHWLAAPDAWQHDVQFMSIDGTRRGHLMLHQYREMFGLRFAGLRHEQIDCRALAEYVIHSTQDRGLGRIDLEPVAKKFGISPPVLRACIEFFCERKFVTRVPKRNKPFLIWLATR